MVAAWRRGVPSGLLWHPTYLLSKLAAIGRRRVIEELATEDLGARLPHNRLHHLAVLSCLADFGPVCQRRVGEHLGMDSSDLVAVLDDLERAGWVDRQRDQRDRRRQHIPAGAAHRHRARAAPRPAAARARAPQPAGAVPAGAGVALLRRRSPAFSRAATGRSC
jgi:DNA-binding MarR family transcriptional regulator